MQTIFLLLVSFNSRTAVSLLHSFWAPGPRNCESEEKFSWHNHLGKVARINILSSLVWLAPTPNGVQSSSKSSGMLWWTQWVVPTFRLDTFYLGVVITYTVSYHQPACDGLAPEKSLFTVCREKSVISAAESRLAQEFSLAFWGMWRKVSLMLIIINYASLIAIQRRMLKGQIFPEPNRWHPSHLGMLHMDIFPAKGKDVGWHPLEHINVGCTSSPSSSYTQPITADCAAEYFVKGQQPLFLLLLMRWKNLPSFWNVLMIT